MVVWVSLLGVSCVVFFFFFFNDTATTEIYTLSLHDALPISCIKKYIVGKLNTAARNGFQI